MVRRTARIMVDVTFKEALDNVRALYHNGEIVSYPKITAEIAKDYKRGVIDLRGRRK